MSQQDPKHWHWRKSSFSQGGNCVLVAFADGLVHVRDSKDPEGPILSFTGPVWNRFLDEIRSGALETTDGVPKN